MCVEYADEKFIKVGTAEILKIWTWTDRDTFVIFTLNMKKMVDVKRYR